MSVITLPTTEAELVSMYLALFNKPTPKGVSEEDHVICYNLPPGCSHEKRVGHGLGWPVTAKINSGDNNVVAFIAKIGSDYAVVRVLNCGEEPVSSSALLELRAVDFTQTAIEAKGE